MKGDGRGAVDVLGALLVLLDVADVDVRAGGEFALGESCCEALAAGAQRTYSTCAEFTFAIRILSGRVQHERRKA